MKIKLLFVFYVISSSIFYSQEKLDLLNVNVGMIRNFAQSEEEIFYAPYFEFGYSRKIFSGYSTFQIYAGYWNDFVVTKSRQDKAFYSYVFGFRFSVSPNFIYHKLNLPINLIGGISYHFNNFKEVRYDSPVPIQAFHSGSNYDMLTYFDLGIEIEIKFFNRFYINSRIVRYSLLENGDLVYPINRIAGSVGVLYQF